MTTSGAVRWFTWKMTTRPVAHRGFREALGGIARRELHNAPDASKLLGLRPCPYVKYFHLICYTDRECGIKIGVVCIIWVAGGMFTIGFRGCDFHEKDACGSAGSASLTGSGPSAGSSQAVPLLNATFWTLWKATKPRAVDVPALATPNMMV